MTENTNNIKTAKVKHMPKQYYSENQKMKQCSDNFLRASVFSVPRKRKTKRFKSFACAFVGAFILSIGCGIFASAFSVGYTVEVDDTVVGVVAAKSEYYEVLDEVKTEVRNIADIEFEPAGEESFRVEIVKRSDFTQKEELAENLKSTSEKMVESFSITQEGAFVCALSTEEEAKSILDKYLESRVGDKENVTASFASEVEVAKMHVPEGTIKTKEDAYSTLLAGKVISHEVAAGESLEDIANCYNTTVESILEANEKKETDIFTGTILEIYTGEPILSVKTVEHINGEFEVAYKTEQKEDKNLYRGRTEVEVKGIAGIKYVESYVTRVDGVVTEEKFIRDELIKDAITLIERAGTKEPPPSVGTGTFVMPTSGKLTSPYGARWGRTHAGIDVGASTGTPIYAADNGIVVEAQYKNNGYGNFISIDHGNGFVTYYAHCSEILISPGDVVAKGDLIAKVGSTGRSTGPHLHFEVRQDGVAQNPLNYVK